jgi:hypothetical protein
MSKYGVSAKETESGEQIIKGEGRDSSLRSE